MFIDIYVVFIKDCVNSLFYSFLSTEINAIIPSEATNNLTASSEISPNISPCSTVDSSSNNIQTRQTATSSEQQPITASNDDAILSRDNEEIVSSLKRPRETSSPFDVTSEIKAKKIQTSIQVPSDPVADANYYKVSLRNDLSGTSGEFMMMEGTDEQKEDDSSLGVFRCGQCDKVFAQKSVLQMHVCTRTPNKPYQCGFCGNAFGNPNELRVHASAHCNEKPFKCGYCFRSFSGATTLNNHIRTHTGEKPFNCETCGKTFSQGSQLSKHQRLSFCYKHVEELTSRIM
jgi:KRAB domain-containing zinc finger protein